MWIYLILMLSTLMATGKSLFCKAIGTSKYSKRETMILNFKSFFVAFASSLLFSINRIDEIFDISIFSLVLSVFFGISVATTQVMQAKAMGNGSSSLVTLIYSCGFLIPIFYGLIFWNEEASIFQWIGIGLIVVALFLIIYNGKGEGKLSSWLPFAIIAMLGSGINAIFQKTHQYSDFANELPLFLVCSLLFSAVFTGIATLFIKESKSEKIQLSKKEKTIKILVPICLGICVGALNFLNLMLSGKIPSAILFPIYNIGSLILTSVISAIIFKDRITKKQFVGLAIGVIAILMVGIL